MVRSRWPCSMLVNLARLVFSQSCSVLRSVVSRKLSIIVLMLSLSSATSPRASTWIDRVKSPLVTAVATSAMARTWVVRFAASRLTLPVKVLPGAGGAGHVGLAAEPAFDADFARHGRHLIGEGRERVRHVVDGFGKRRHLAFRFHCEILLEVAVGDRGHHFHDAAHLFGEVGGHDVDGVGQILPGTGHAGHLRLAAEQALGADFARHAGNFRGEAVELVHHRIDGVFQFENFALHVDRDFTAKVAARHGGGHLGDVADLRRKVRGKQVDVVGQDPSRFRRPRAPRPDRRGGRRCRPRGRRA